jgi:hypothetical protein
VSETTAPVEPRRRRRYGVLGYQLKTLTATIASGQSLSGPVYPAGRVLRVFVPTGTTGAALLPWIGINEQGATFGPSRSPVANMYNLLSFAAGDCLELAGGGVLEAAFALKLQSTDAAGSPVTQAADRVLTLVVATG